MTSGICRLCGKSAELQESHIIPGFVFRWLKESSATGYLRFSQQPNRRVQDGLKISMLCADCERCFNEFETEFANTVFHPLTAGDTDTVSYDSWMFRFCVSVSWRVLAFYLDQGHNDHVPDYLMPKVREVEALWREFLVGNNENIGNTEQHFLPLGVIESLTRLDAPPNINRYISRAVDMDIVSSTNSVFVYSKLGPFMILGFVEMPNSCQWVGTKLELDRGVIGPRKYVLPAGFDDFIFDKARKTAKAQETMSDRQKESIDRAFRKDIDRSARSESFRAMSHDVKLFGNKAFDKK